MKLKHHTARDRGRSIVHAPQSEHLGHPTPYPTPYNYAPQPIIVTMPQCPGHQGNNAAPCGTVLPMSNTVAAPVDSQASPSTSSLTNTVVSNVDIPVDKWFCYLDRHEERNKDGITFSPYGIALKEMGFNRLSHLTAEFFTLADLQGWLGVGPGTANTILHYVKGDLNALKSGKWVFPKDL